MTIKEFLAENREVVIAFYNNEIKDYWAISLKDFMNDVLENFRKTSIKKDFTKTDLNGNLIEAKSRLGLFNKVAVEAKDKITDRLRNKYKGTAYMAMV